MEREREGVSEEGKGKGKGTAGEKYQNVLCHKNRCSQEFIKIVVAKISQNQKEFCF